MACQEILATIPSGKCFQEGDEDEFQPFECPSHLSLCESPQNGFVDFSSNAQLFKPERPPNISHELNVAKSLLQTGSTKTGDNLFDHLAEIIKRAVNEPRENLVDFFEEYSHNLRLQKFRIDEPFKWTFYEPPDVQRAKRVLSMIKLTSPENSAYDVCRLYKFDHDEEEEDRLGCGARRMLALSENVQRLHLYWSLCGFNISKDEAVHLSMAMQKIQFLPKISHARFWGKIFGLRKPYYVVEARLTPAEIKLRLEAMKCEMIENIRLFPDSGEDCNVEEDPKFIPGYTWRDHPDKLDPTVPPMPKPKPEIKFNVPPEPVGAGTNKLTYFVVNSLLDDWIELPIVTPKQVQVSRLIRRMFTGDLEADVVTYPQFPGQEKHLLRAMIARITAGTFVAPENYYRRMTRLERMEVAGEEYLEQELEDEEEEDIDNDAFIIEDQSYEPSPNNLKTPRGWVHVRPNILNQGRVRWFDVEKARKQLEGEEEKSTEDVSEADELDEEEFEDNETVSDEGRDLFSKCSEDRNSECVQSWSARLSSVHNKISQVILMRSNLWPGAFAFASGKYSDCLYMGWGHKYTARNTQIPHLPPVCEQFEFNHNLEISDPTPEMELAYETWLKNKDKQEMSELEEEEDTDSCNEVV